MGQRIITTEFRKYFEINLKETIIYQNLLDAAKSMLKYIAVNVYIKKDFKSLT